MPHILSLLSAISAVAAFPYNSLHERQDTPDAFRYLGRVNPATQELTWPGSGITFSFQGSSASLPIRSISGANAIEVTIDDGEPIIIDNVNTSSITTPAALSAGSHTVSIRRKSEAQYGTLVISPPTTTGQLTTIPQPPKRIEIIGDSISVGYGLDGVFPCVNSAALEDAPNTYGALAARALGYDYSIVAWSGRGLLRNYVSPTPDASPVMPELWTRYGANDADGSYDFAAPVDVVVVTLGTNDFSYILTDANGQAYAARPPVNADDFTAGMVDFVGRIRAKYPDAEIFLASSPMLSDSYPTAEDAQHSTQANATIRAVEMLGEKTHFVEFPPQGSEVGCDYHPSAGTHVQMAGMLTEAIRGVVGS